MKNKMGFIDKRTVLKMSIAMAAVAVVAAFMCGKEGFDEGVFAILLLILGFIGDFIIRSEMIAVFCNRFPEWKTECENMSGRKMKLRLSAPQEAKLLEYMDKDECGEQLKKEYRFYENVSMMWRGIPAIVIMVVLLWW